MVAFSPAEGLSIIEIVIFGFMATNVALIGSFAIQRGYQRLSSARSE